MTTATRYLMTATHKTDTKRPERIRTYADIDIAKHAARELADTGDWEVRLQPKTYRLIEARHQPAPYRTDACQGCRNQISKFERRFGYTLCPSCRQRSHRKGGSLT